MARESLVDLSAALASRREAAVGRALRVADAHAAPSEIEETLLQAHLFVGFPIVLEAFFQWRAAAQRTPSASSDYPPESWQVSGEETCRIIYSANYEKLRANVARLHPDLDLWMLTGGYGRVLSRQGLALAERELCIVALLSVWDAPRQLHSHARGALNAGASMEDLRAAIHVACRYLTPRRIEELNLVLRNAGLADAVSAFDG